MANKKEKRIEDYKKTKPMELVLFQEIPLGDDHGNYCNLIEFYDLIPRPFGCNLKRENAKYLPTFERRFTFDKKEYQVSLQPARIKTKEGEKEFFPGKREELIEDALRKIAMDNDDSCMFFNGAAGVKFTMNQLIKELKRVNCTTSYEEIRQSLEILAGSTMKIKAVNDKGDEFNLISSLLSVLIFNERFQYENGEKNCLACFHPFVTNSIVKKTFRLYDYKTSMKLKGFLSRYLYKRLCYNFGQAGLQDSYGINLTTLIKDSGLDQNRPLWRNFDTLKRAIGELIKNGIIKTVKYEKRKEGRKVQDVKIMIWVTDWQISKTIKSHFVSKELKTN